MAELEMRLGVGFTGKIEFVVNWNETIVYVLGFCVGIKASRSFWAWIFRFSDRASGNLRSVLLCGKTRLNRLLFNIVRGRSPGDSCKRSDNKWCTVEVRWGIFIENMTVFYLFLRAVVNIPVQTLVIISPWLLFCKMIISQLDLGPPVKWPETKLIVKVLRI